jgi:very-short-patch-repair endonuclease
MGIPRKTTIQFIEEANIKHNNFYDYSITTYTTNNTNLDILCKDHGVFSQTPLCHLKGTGCMMCINLIRKKPTLSFINECNKTHGDLYDYSKVEYKTNKVKVEIICNTHGSFFQTPKNHCIGKQGCNKCKYSIGEKAIDRILNALNIQFIPQYKFPNQWNNISRCRYDFWLPTFNTIIEYHGIQHYIRNSFFHKSDTDFINQVERDKMKKEYCIENNINLIEIPYQQLFNIEKIILQHIQNAGNS